MFDLGDNRPELAEKWRSQLDFFVDDYQVELAALAWGLKQEWSEDGDVLGNRSATHSSFCCLFSRQSQQTEQKY